VLLEVRCPVCAEPGRAPCAACAATTRAAPPGLVPPPPLQALHAALTYEGVGRELVARLKYRDARAAVGWLAATMVQAMPAPLPGTVVTWAPTTAARRRHRGFDQAELLARAVARRAGLPTRATLLRAAGPAQTGRDLAHRTHPTGFRARHRVPRARPVLVVDDVVTSGATLAAAGRALVAAGAWPVTGLVAAVTPPPGW